MRVCSHCGNPLHLPIYTCQYRDSIIKMRHFHSGFDFSDRNPYTRKVVFILKIVTGFKVFFFQFLGRDIFPSSLGLTASCLARLLHASGRDLHCQECLLIVVWRVGETTTLHWRHNELVGVSNHQLHGCLLNHLFRRRSKKTSKLCVTGLCAGNSPGPVNSPHKGPVTRKMFPFDDVIMKFRTCCRAFPFWLLNRRTSGQETDRWVNALELHLSCTNPSR